MARKCVKFKQTAAGRRCAKYSSFGDVDDAFLEGEGMFGEIEGYAVWCVPDKKTGEIKCRRITGKRPRHVAKSSRPGTYAEYRKHPSRVEAGKRLKDSPGGRAAREAAEAAGHACKVKLEKEGKVHEITRGRRKGEMAVDIGPYRRCFATKMKAWSKKYKAKK
jgi:hypothetical protein